MKNRLEDEYRQLMQNETPDLWSRIEAGIDAKIAADKEVAVDACVEVNEDTPAEMTENSTGVVVDFEAQMPIKNKKRGASFWKKYSLPLVACIAAVLCVPLMLTGILRMAGGGSKSESAAADTAAAEEFNTTTTEAEDAPAEEYLYEAAAEEEAAVEDTPAEAPESIVDEETTEGSISNWAQDTAEDLAEEIAETEMKEKEEQQILTVIIVSAKEGVLGEERVKGTIYYLTTEEVGECTVFVPSDLAYVIDLGQQTKIVVEQGNDEYDYVFVEMAE